MKNLKTLLFIALMSSLCLTAQNSDTKKADKQFARFEFVKAAESYKKLVDSGKGDPYVYAQLAESYYNIFSTVEAERWYAKALETSQNPELIYKYSEMLKANGKYEESNQQMEKFASMRPSDNRATAFRKNPNYLPKILEQGKNSMYKMLALIRLNQILEVLCMTANYTLLLAVMIIVRLTVGTKNLFWISIRLPKLGRLLSSCHFVKR